MAHLEHHVWALPPGEEKPRFMASFCLERWQWAEKFAGYLRDSGYAEVEIRTAPEEDRPVRRG
jgi:hypothetical protein